MHTPNRRKNEIIERYLYRIRQEVYNLTPVDDFIDNLRQDLYDYEEMNPDFTEDDLELEFGTPMEIAKDYLEGTTAIHPEMIAKSKKRRNIIIFTLIIALLVTTGYLVDLHHQQQSKATDVIIIEE